MNKELKNKVVSKDEWLKASRSFLEKEKSFTKEREELSSERQKLPWLKIDKDYIFRGETGDVSLSELFADRSQLIIYHFMFAPEWSQGCPSCSFVADHYNPAVIHLANHDVSLVTVSRAPLEKIKAFKKRMEWDFPWVSSMDNSFNRDFRVSFTEKETKSGLKLYNHATSPINISDAPGISVFYKDDEGEIYLTYATFSRGLDIFLNTYNFLDISPKGRNEEEGMEWVKHHDLYEGGKRELPWVDTPINSVRE
jgi:predicted dithiol-disulfide oxidoreductase (DUF899 family)